MYCFRFYLANKVRKAFEQEYAGKPVVLLNIQQLQSAVYRARTKSFSDWESQICQFPLAFCTRGKTAKKKARRVYGEFLLKFLVRSLCYADYLHIYS
jgi:hypothetical protein